MILSTLLVDIIPAMNLNDRTCCDVKSQTVLDKGLMICSVSMRPHATETAHCKGIYFIETHL